ncbi:hypothetical protein [Neofamilia massiliensis]|uniref:hypothetical protein n=1 Tax=Neofamilia massiliensis TaxID=1673724 RepID=UPI0006BB65BC|nr:hypothetical protein [Neofamilia massiliensis]
MKKINKNLSYILIVSLAIILLSSLEALITAKSSEAFELFKAAYPGSQGSDYLSFVLVYYLSNIIEPIILSVFLFLTFDKIKIKGIHKLVFAGIVLVRILRLIFSFNIASIFFYIILALYVVLFILLVRYEN